MVFGFGLALHSCFDRHVGIAPLTLALRAPVSSRRAPLSPWLDRMSGRLMITCNYARDNSYDDSAWQPD